ncbi:hypothetical protein LTR37_015022 [Vermiconidia calcicola]|uniref:Uncharacterized protein n=1 Tax=Vermiconidia calcicola TaxID=1690605 RepID=A0ACC3MSI8_9PEZI|nr:hypothetical protein LTR37_015022 [Vermiconidia calcicola]
MIVPFAKRSKRHTGACHFFDKLPAEVRHMIYEEAYASEADVSKRWKLVRASGPLLRLIDKCRPFTRAKKGAASDHYLFRDFLVSRKFYDEAVPVFVRSHTFHFYGHHSFYKAIAYSPTLRHNLTQVHLDISCTDKAAYEIVFESFNGCPRLTRTWLILHHKFYLGRCPHDTRAKVEAQANAALRHSFSFWGHEIVNRFDCAVEVVGLNFGVKALGYGLSRRVKTGKAQWWGLYDERVETHLTIRFLWWARNEVWYRMPLA